MTKTQFLEQLTAQMDKNGHSQLDVARLTGVGQSRVSRILKGQFERFSSKSVSRLAKYASISIDTPSDPRRSRLLMAAVAAVWDGSKQHEIALARLLHALKGLT